MPADESPQCLKAPADFPNELWLLNPLPGDLKQHAQNIENRQHQKPILSSTRGSQKAHGRKESGNIYLQAIDY